MDETTKAYAKSRNGSRLSLSTTIITPLLSQIAFLITVPQYVKAFILLNMLTIPACSFILQAPRVGTDCMELSPTYPAVDGYFVLLINISSTIPYAFASSAVIQ